MTVIPGTLQVHARSAEENCHPQRSADEDGMIWGDGGNKKKKNFQSLVVFKNQKVKLAIGFVRLTEFRNSINW